MLLGHGVCSGFGICVSRVARQTVDYKRYGAVARYVAGGTETVRGYVECDDKSLFGGREVEKRGYDV